MGPTIPPHAIATTNLDPKTTPYAPPGPPPAPIDPYDKRAPIAQDTGARPDLTARTPRTEANKPAPDVQPVSATRATPRVTQPAVPATPGFGTLTRPNIDQSQGGRGGGGPPQMGMLDLSHLWGPNPPLAQRAATPAPVPSGQIAPPPGGGPTPYPGPTLNPTGQISLPGGNQPNPNADVRVPTPMPPPRPLDLDKGDNAVTASRKRRTHPEIQQRWDTHSAYAMRFSLPLAQCRTPRLSLLCPILIPSWVTVRLAA